MAHQVPNPELLRSLGRLVRGLSALFWGLPAAMVVCFYTARAEGLRSLGMVPLLPPLATTGLLVFGLWQLADFQKQERVWRNALDRARVLSLITFGLSPFLYWWGRIPTQPFFLWMAVAFAISALLFLASLNSMLRRLGAMLPDETLRLETRQFTQMNLYLLCASFVAAIAYWGLPQFRSLPRWLAIIAAVMERGSLWFLSILLLLPLAMTMALLWKTKEVILDSVFSAKE